ncbi:oligosaccharide flippase family protein [Vibrio brasiliensis]|uniref:lipopolysaccharide biosynthesis protein n=1 Tax=Vibrio brasiliensis TaxID=170652 RepID=UPI001EFD340B|nr:oligosaccharide flippase family protein [Vibrio brasiliensis]MCG9751319.1 oligosaccharide flippase family protein [Vibrio brasiliensis]MCG9783133.1 oligosaccharide flippase family protein [Vibrio brasiliensis]
MKNNHLKDMSLYAISLFLIKGVSLFTLPLMAHYLSPDELGHLELLGITTVFFSLIVGLAMHENLYRFIGPVRHKKLRKAKANKLYSTSLVISFSLTLLVLTLYLLLPINFDAFNSSQIGLMLMVLCYEAPLAICLAWLRLHNQASLFFKICTLTVIIQVALLVTVLTNNPDVTLIFAINVLCTLAQFLFLHCYLRFGFRLPKFSQARQYLHYSMPLMLSAVVAFGLSGAERWLIAAATDLQTLGMYAIAAKFALGVGILIQPFHMWWMPKRFESLQVHGADYTARVTQRGVLLLCFIAISVSWLSQIFIALALPSAYHPAMGYVSLTITMMLFKELVELSNIGVLYRKKTPQLLYINIFATIVALGVCLATIDYGLYAILLALILGQVTRFVLTLYRSQQLFSLNYQIPALIGLLLLTVTFIVTSRYHQHLEVSMLMLVLQPLALLAFAIRCRLISLDSIKGLFSAMQTYLGRTQ